MYALSTTDLYWLYSDTEPPIRVASTIGQLHLLWPSTASRALNLVVSSQDLDGTTLPNGRTLDWTEEHSFLARLSFFPIKLSADAPAASEPRSSGLAAARNFSCECSSGRIV